MQLDETLKLEFETARKNRKFEIEKFWQRANYFLVLNTALAVGIFTIKSAPATFLISIFGIIAAWLWFRTNVGARYWQVFWEAEVHELSKELKIRSFSKTDDEVAAMQTTFGRSRKRSFLRKIVDTEVKKGHSVSYNMILLSIWSIVGWCIIFTFFVAKYIIENCSCAI